MNIHLVVVQDFGPHTKGSRISDPVEVATVLAGESADKVVRVLAPDAPSSSPSFVSEA